MKNLILYFSPTGHTRAAAEEVQKTLGGTLIEIVPRDKYTEADLDWENENSRTSIEHKDPKIMPAIMPVGVNPQNFDNVFIGFPIWWYKEPAVIRTFVNTHNLKGLQLYPFCTSGESPVEEAEIDLSNRYPDLNWHDGLRFPATPEQVKRWYEDH